MVRKAGAWFDRRPLWLLAIVAFPVAFGGWAGAAYLDAWLYGGAQPGDMGFPHGQFSVAEGMINAAVLTAAVVGKQLWRRRRAAKAT